MGVAELTTKLIVVAAVLLLVTYDAVDVIMVGVAELTTELIATVLLLVTDDVMDVIMVGVAELLTVVLLVAEEMVGGTEKHLASIGRSNSNVAIGIAVGRHGNKLC